MKFEDVTFALRCSRYYRHKLNGQTTTRQINHGFTDVRLAYDFHFADDQRVLIIGDDNYHLKYYLFYRNPAGKYAWKSLSTTAEKYESPRKMLLALVMDLLILKKNAKRESDRSRTQTPLSFLDTILDELSVAFKDGLGLGIGSVPNEKDDLIQKVFLNTKGDVTLNGSHVIENLGKGSSVTAGIYNYIKGGYYAK